MNSLQQAVFALQCPLVVYFQGFFFVHSDHARHPYSIHKIKLRFLYEWNLIFGVKLYSTVPTKTCIILLKKTQEALSNICLIKHLYSGKTSSLYFNILFHAFTRCSCETHSSSSKSTKQKLYHGQRPPIVSPVLTAVTAALWDSIDVLQFCCCQHCQCHLSARHMTNINMSLFSQNTEKRAAAG